MNDSTLKVGTREIGRLAKMGRTVPTWVLPAVKLFVITVDASISAFCLIFAFTLREGDPVLSSTAWAWSTEFVPYSGILYFSVLVIPAMLAYQSAYRFLGAFSYAQEVIKIFKAVAVGSLLIVAWAFLFRGGFAFRDFSYSRAVFILNFIFALVTLLAFHILLRFVQTRFRRRGINLIPTLIIGRNHEAEQTIRELGQQRDLGYRVIGVLNGTTDELESNGEWEVDESKIPIFGDLDQMADVVRKFDIQEVIITDHRLSSDRLFEAMMQIGRKQKVEFRFAPSLFELLPQKTSVEQIGVLPMVRLFREPLSEVERFVKRASDIIISTVTIILSTPFWLLCAMAVRLDSRGPILFKQERVGMDGRIFLCYKFRTMHNDADEEIHREAYRRNIAGDDDANTGDVAEPVFGKVKDDTRVTRFGKWLRRSSIDELPQFLNVLKGDMSVVGPRPPIPYEVEEYNIWHRKRLDMKPGITGLWQVSGRNRLSFEEMVRIDLYYIENWSLWLDLKIILLTLPAMFRGDGAR